MVEDTERLSYNPPCAVSYNRLTDFLACNNAAAVSAALVLLKITDETVIN